MIAGGAARAMAMTVLGVVLGSQALAEAPRRPKVILLDFPSVKAFDDATNKVLDDFYASDLRQQGFAVITNGDVIAALGIERQKELLGCTETSCLAELGGAMGSDYIARGSIAVLEDETALSLSLVNPSGVEINRVSSRSKSRTASALLSQLETLVGQLVQPLRDQGKLGPAGPSTRTAAVGGVEQTSPPSSVKGWWVGGFVTAGAGALIGLSALLPLHSSNVAYGQVADGSLANGGQVTSTLNQGNTDRTIAASLLAAGVVGVGVGATLILTHWSAEPTAASIAVNPVERSVVATVAFP
jgi:hypothetical protein